MTGHAALRRILRTTVASAAILVTVAVSPASPESAEAQVPTPFLASPYYGAPVRVTRRFGSGHNGIDFSLSYVPILAAAGGTINTSGWYDPACHDEGWPGCAGGSGYGLYVRITHSNGYETRYGHLSVTRESPVAVNQAQWIGTSGDTGWSTGPHLHFEVRHNGVAVDPDNYNGGRLWSEGEWAAPDRLPSISKPEWRFPILQSYDPTTTVDDTPDNTGGFKKGRSDVDKLCPPYNECPEWHRTTTSGYGGDAHYLLENGNQTYYVAHWQPDLPYSGIYEVRLRFPCFGARSERTWFAAINISGPWQNVDLRVDQVDRCDQPLSLGHYYFDRRVGALVTLTGDTGTFQQNRRILADAVEFQPVRIGAFEAENYREKVDRSSHRWGICPGDAQCTSPLPGGYSGAFMEGLPDNGWSRNSDYRTTSPELRYRVVFPDTGIYYAWLRGYGDNGSEDSIHAGVDNTAPPTADRISGCWNTTSWNWCNMTMDDGHSPATIWVASPGLHTFNLWMREDGLRVDRLELVADSSWRGGTLGPIEVEGYDSRVGRNGYNWEFRNWSGKPGWRGWGAMQALPNTGQKYESDYWSQSPELGYKVYFPQAGRYYVWVRAWGASANDDSVHAGYDSQHPASAWRIAGCGWDGAGWKWCSQTMSGGRAYIDVSSAGWKTFKLWMREDGFRADQILLTREPNFTPQ